ncbi:MAG: helix-turn-helix transcriptional regulator [Acidimicrobiales bacterium]
MEIANNGGFVPWYRIRGGDGLGRTLRACRRDARLTQAALAERLGIERTTVLNMEASRNPVLERLVSAFATCGFDLVAVPRDATVRVVEVAAEPSG